MKQHKIAVVVSVIVCALAGGAMSQEKVPGETWRMKMSMQAEGFSMPARTTEICMPKANPEQAMIQPSSDSGNCSVSNMRTSGNKTSADIKCTGKEAMEGHMEVEKLAENSVRGMMTGRTSEMSMKMEYEYTKLGKACEAVDYSNYKPPVVNIPVIDHCAQVVDKLDRDDLAAVGVALLNKYPTRDGTGVADCTSHAAFKTFCSAVQTPAGFAGLDYEQWQRRDVQAGANEGADVAARMTRAPLTESLRACGLGADNAAVAGLQKRMLDVAAKERAWGFLLYYGSDAQYPVLQGIAGKECSGRSFTNAANSDYRGLCRRYGAALVRNDRAGTMQAAGCSVEREDRARGICIGATSDGTGAMASIGSDAGAVAAGASGTAQPEDSSDAATAAEDEEKGAKDKAKDALDKGRKALRGLFGGG